MHIKVLLNIYKYIYKYHSSSGLNKQLSNCANDIKKWLISNNLLLIPPKLRC